MKKELCWDGCHEHAEIEHLLPPPRPANEAVFRLGATY